MRITTFFQQTMVRAERAMPQHSKTVDPSVFGSIVACVLLVTGCMVSSVPSQSQEQKEDAMSIKHVTDSLSALGEHGFFVAQYLVGRFKTSRFKVDAFAVSVSRIDARLVEHPILFRVSDTLTYQLSYSLDGRRTELMGEFDKPLEDEQMAVLVVRPANNDSASFRRLISDFAYTDIELRVYEY